MNLDNILMIPHLSKELNLIGHTTLPYKLVKTPGKCKNKNNAFSIVFDSKQMLDNLILVCLELVKQVKSLSFDTEDTCLEKINFEKLKLEKQCAIYKSEIKKANEELSLAKNLNICLQEENKFLEMQIKDFKAVNTSLLQKCTSNENALTKKLNKKESELISLHKVLWKQSSLGDQNFFPQNFEIIQLEQPNFNKLWSEVKYSSHKDKEDALKKAICLFQENNNSLMQDNILLKNILFATLKEVSEVVELMFSKMHLQETIRTKENICEIFKDVEKINVHLYKQILNKHFVIIRKVCEFFDAAFFSVSDEHFICWSDMIIKLKEWIKTNNADIDNFFIIH